MPGQKSISWTPENKVNFLDALLAYASVKIDNETALAIAKHCGVENNAKCVHSLLQNSRARFQPRNGAPGKDTMKTKATVTSNLGIGASPTVNRTITGRVAKPNPAKKTAKDTKKVRNVKDEALEIDNASKSGIKVKNDDSMTVVKTECKSCEPTQGENNETLRKASRATPKVNYQAPKHLGYESEAAGEPSESEEEDSQPSDKEYETEGNEPDEDVLSAASAA